MKEYIVLHEKQYVVAHFFCKNSLKNKFAYKEVYVKYLCVETSKAYSGLVIVFYQR